MNNLITLAIKELKKRKYDAYFISIANENLYEFTRPIDNFVMDLTGFTGDTGSLLITKNKCYLYVDGRFTIQAKKEVNDSRIKIVEISRRIDRVNDIIDRVGKNAKLVFNPKKESIDSIFYYRKSFEKQGIKLLLDSEFLSKMFVEIKKDYFNLTSAPLFVLDKKYTSKNSKTKIKECLDILKEENGLPNDIYYVTSSLEEIAYLTNLRYRFSDIDNHSVLFDAFFIANSKKSTLYIKDYLEDDASRYIEKSGIDVKEYSMFYSDLKKLKSKNKCYLDKTINNYYIYKCLQMKNTNIVDSPIEMSMSLKGDIEIKNLRSCNILDGIAMTKAIYKLKNANLKENNLTDEYKIKKYIDKLRVDVGKSKYLCPSFETIVAYKSNSAICHYTPTEKKSKKVANDGLLLIDSGGNYLSGTTDITRTISLYRKKIPEIVKKHYTLVLEGLISLAMLKFPHGLTGFEVDIIARKNLYDEYLDFNHGTGHGIGYISNVHEGPNRIGPIVNSNFEKNVLSPYQLTSDEPGLYFENKYGIRIENDLLTIPLKSNEYGDFLGFETLTLCPYDRDLIDKKYLSANSILFLNKYNKLVYNKLSRFLNNEEKNWLKKETREV